ncbi:MAG: hypothetical protein KJN77_06955 [Gammaproteobacteria bacterium]|nr:hypothetical protein [Gammaproteobacteria bacterium]
MSHKHLQPIDPRDAFAVQPEKLRKGQQQIAAAEEADSIAASQAAMLLALRAGVLGSTPTTERIPGFKLPDTRSLRRTHRIKVAEACRHLGVSPGELAQEKHPAIEKEMARVADELYRKPSIEAAAALFEAALVSPHPLVAVAAAAGARETTRLRPKIRATLEQCAKSRDPLVSRLAVTAMSYIGPMESMADKKVVRRPKSRLRRRWSRTAVITHGTFAANGRWYRPGGNFYEALDSNRPDLHLHDRSFRWTGAYSGKGRRADARLLKQWILDQRLSRPDFFAHSHGGTVANLATMQGAQFDRLVLMGWPVHEQWFPDFSKVKRIVDVRVRLDLVIMLDLGRQRFRTRKFNVEEHRNGWFDHSSTHDPAYWDQHGIWDVI